MKTKEKSEHNSRSISPTQCQAKVVKKKKKRKHPKRKYYGNFDRNKTTRTTEMVVSLRGEPSTIRNVLKIIHFMHINYVLFPCGVYPIKILAHNDANRLSAVAFRASHKTTNDQTINSFIDCPRLRVRSTFSSFVFFFSFPFFSFVLHQNVVN